jgi:hypothetical protein
MGVFDAVTRDTPKLEKLHRGILVRLDKLHEGGGKQMFGEQVFVFSFHKLSRA